VKTTATTQRRGIPAAVTAGKKRMVVLAFRRSVSGLLRCVRHYRLRKPAWMPWINGYLVLAKG
jgi:hypothetical protein